MNDVLEFFHLNDAVPLLLLICLLQFSGSQIAGNSVAVRWWARGFAAAGFLAYAITGIGLWEPTRASKFVEVVVRALLAMGTVHGLALVTVPVLLLLHEHLWARPLERQRALEERQAWQAEIDRQKQEAAEREREERELIAAEERRKQEELRNRPPPPTREELLIAAQRRLDTTLRLIATATLDDTELRAARERAKQAYLRELDQVMK